jgi:hypothetical protein
MAGARMARWQYVGKMTVLFMFAFNIFLMYHGGP